VQTKGINKNSVVEFLFRVLVLAGNTWEDHPTFFGWRWWSLDVPFNFLWFVCQIKGAISRLLFSEHKQRKFASFSVRPEEKTSKGTLTSRFDWKLSELLWKNEKYNPQCLDTNKAIFLFKYSKIFINWTKDSKIIKFSSFWRKFVKFLFLLLRVGN